MYSFEIQHAVRGRERTIFEPVWAADSCQSSCLTADVSSLHLLIPYIISYTIW